MDVVFEKFVFLKEKIRTVIQGNLISLERKEDLAEKYQEKIKLILKERLMVFERIIELASVKVDAVNPEYIFKKGYSAVFDEKGTVVRNSNDLEIGQKLKIKFHQGSANTEVISRK